MNKFFKDKVYKYFGSFGLKLISLFNIDILPVFLKTNFYVVASKSNNK